MTPSTEQVDAEIFPELRFLIAAVAIVMRAHSALTAIRR